MEDRDFSEVELRGMFEDAAAYREDVQQGRWVVETRHRARRWEVIVVPDTLVSLEEINRVLERIGQPPLDENEMEPLRARVRIACQDPGFTQPSSKKLYRGDAEDLLEPFSARSAFQR
ncbi:MAG: hypothetical protein GEU90_20900 [Gemmatimonas sp.]|nr:hypothetical protein [Gemmatimonas sp.]